MRIAFITTQINLKTGGGSNISPHLKARSMATAGHDVTMITFFPEKNSFLETPPYKVIELPTRFKNWFLLQTKIFFILRKYERDFDVFAFEGEHFVWGAGLYRTLFGQTPVLMHFNGPIFSIYEHGAAFNALRPAKKSFKTKISEWLRRTFEKNIGIRFARKIDIFTSDSPLIKEWHREFGFIGEKIIVMPAFVDLEDFSGAISAKEAVRKNKINILYVGRLVQEKGVDTLLTAIQESQNKDKISVNIVGRGTEQTNLEEMAKNLNIQKLVKFHPWSNKETLNNLYHEADIFVHPARWAEPLGLTVIEAMAAGLPVIVPEISGSVWAAGEGGLSFKNGNHADLRSKIEKLLADEDLRRSLAEKAKKRAEEFDYRRSIKKLEEILYNLTLK